MLLYDHLREHAERSACRIGLHRFGPENCNRLLHLRHAVVYELSDLVPLFGDWSTEKDKPIPKRPPHPDTWAEWRYTDSSLCGRYGDDWTIGTLIASIPPDELATLRTYSPVPPGAIGTMIDVAALDLHVQNFRNFLFEDKEYYYVQIFKRLDASRPNPEGAATCANGESVPLRERRAILRQEINQPRCDLGTFIWSQRPDGTGVHRYKLMPSLATHVDQRHAQTDTAFFLPVLASFGHKPYWQLADPWPPFLAFALLHCKNVVTEEHTPDPALQRRVRKAGNPPRVTYKTLRIEVPATAHKRQAYTGDQGEDDGPRVRFHLCSGHFKNLQHERYKEKGWHWWPAHWRGSKELGEVHKRYELTPKA